MQVTAFLVILLCINLTNGLYIENTENNNNETKNIQAASLAEQIIKENVQAAKVVGIGSQTNLAQSIVMPLEGNKPRIEAKEVKLINEQEATKKRNSDLNKRTGSAFATTYYNGNVTLNTYLSSGNYFMEDLTRNITVVACNDSACSGYTKLTDADNIWTASNQAIATQTQWAAGQVLDYFKTVQGRNGLDGKGGPTSILSENGVSNLLAFKIHYGTDPNYAGFTGTDFVFGDGDGTNYGPMVSLDVVAHEMARAIIGYSCNLTNNYYGQSGSIIEAFGDMTAAVVSQWTFGENNGTYLFGEDNYTPGTVGDALRYMNEPQSAANKGFTADDDPDHISEMYNGTLDNYGVHVNAGILNKVFYLHAKGGNHSNGGVTMSGIGIDSAYGVWYKAVTTYFTSNMSFSDARTATLRAAVLYYGTSNCQQYYALQTAWALCGFGSLPTHTYNVLNNSNFDSGSATPWNVTGNAAWYMRNGITPHSGTCYLKFGETNSGSGTAYQAFSIANNTVLANLTFYIYITSFDSQTVVNDKLYLEIHQSGTILDELAIFSNVDYNTGYFQKQFNLLPYMNLQGIQLVFRVLTDGNAPTTFRVDDVYLTVMTY